MSIAEKYGAIAEAFENAAIAFRALEGATENETTKSPAVAGTAMANGGAKPGGKKATAAPAVAEKPVAKPKAKPAAAAAVTFEVLKAKLTELVNSKGKEIPKEILSGFGANKLIELDEDNYGEVYAQAVAALAADEEVEAEGEDDDMFGS